MLRLCPPFALSQSKGERLDAQHDGLSKPVLSVEGVNGHSVTDFKTQPFFLDSIIDFRSAKGLNVDAGATSPESVRPAISFSFECSCSWQ